MLISVGVCVVRMRSFAFDILNRKHSACAVGLCLNRPIYTESYCSSPSLAFFKGRRCAVLNFIEKTLKYWKFDCH
jgi:hypothetical protein